MRIFKPELEISALEQRLQYARAQPDRSWTDIVENVPVWPNGYPIKDSKRIVDDVTSYPNCTGAPALLDAICRYESSVFTERLSPECVLVTQGALHGLSLIFDYLWQSGARALMHVPVFTAIVASLRARGFAVDTFDVFNTDIVKAVDTALTPNTRLVYINSPHNPTGITYSSRLLARLRALCDERQVSLVIDRVYESFTMGVRHLWSPTANEKCPHFMVNSLSKSFGAPGLRIGWILCMPSVRMKLAAMLERQCVAISGPSQAEASLLLDNGAKDLVDYIPGQGAKVTRYLGEIPGVEIHHPKLGESADVSMGGIQLLARLPVSDVEQFADYLVEEQGLLITTSSNFFAAPASCLRVPFGYPDAHIRRALQLLAEGLSKYREKRS